MTEWEAFVAHAGRAARAHHLAAIVGQPEAAINALRRRVRPMGPRLSFVDLFTRYHGRAPREEEWPAPKKTTSGYEWLPPELALLATLVGQHSVDDIATILTERLRRITGNPTAERTRDRVSTKVNHIGLVQSDVVGGLTTADAAKLAGVTKTLIYQELGRGNLRCFRVGVRLVIPRRAFDEWRAGRLPAPPDGWVKLWDIRRALGQKQDRLSWYARLGLIPQALFCAGHRWWVPPAVADDMVRRRRAGEPMPWAGYAHPSTTKRSYALWQRRRHRSCPECDAIWVRVGGEPGTFQEFHPRWIRIPEAQKRHLTAPDGLSAEKAGEALGVDKHTIIQAIRRRQLMARREGPRWVIRREDLENWVRRPDVLSHHHDEKPLTFRHAAARYRFAEAFLRDLARRGLLIVLRRKDGQDGVRAWQIASLRAQLGDLTLSQAAAAAGVSEPVFLRDARARGWRDGQPFTREWVHRVRSRQEARWQLTFEQAARRLKRSIAWVQRAVDVGVLKILKGVDRRHRVVGRKLVEQLLRNGIPELPPAPRRGRPVEWLQAFAACELAGVTISTLKRWAINHEIRSRPWRSADGPYGPRYHKQSVEKRARQYWQRENRFKRATPPAWISGKAA